MNKKILKIRIFLWMILFFVVAWFLWMKIVPTGRISYNYDFSKENSFISKLTPSDRVEAITDNSQKVIGNPVYFSLFTPRKFKTAKLSITYKNPQDLPIIEAGILVDNNLWRYDLKPIENSILNKLSLVWDVVEDDNLVFLQKNKDYDLISDFLDDFSGKINQENQSKLALYNYDLKTNFVLSDYEPEEEIKDLDFALRGSYQFYTYIKDEDLNFEFDFYDLNKNKDEDAVDLHLFCNDQLIDSVHLDDDGIATDNGEVGEPGSIKFKSENLPEGVYKIEIKTNDDIVTENIKTSQQKIAFLNKIWLEQTGKEDFKIYTDSSKINLQTINPGSLQNVKINDFDLELSETYRQFTSPIISATSTEISFAKDGVILSGNGVFSFESSQLISPGLKKLDNNVDIAKAGIEYILANYSIPEENGEWKVAEVEFDLTKAYCEDNKYSFLISIPDLKADDEVEDFIVINNIKVELSD